MTTILEEVPQFSTASDEAFKTYSQCEKHRAEKQWEDAENRLEFNGVTKIMVYHYKHEPVFTTFAKVNAEFEKRSQGAQRISNPLSDTIATLKQIKKGFDHCITVDLDKLTEELIAEHERLEHLIITELAAQIIEDTKTVRVSKIVVNENDDLDMIAMTIPNFIRWVQPEN